MLQNKPGYYSLEELLYLIKASLTKATNHDYGDLAISSLDLKFSCFIVKKDVDDISKIGIILPELEGEIHPWFPHLGISELHLSFDKKSDTWKLNPKISKMPKEISLLAEHNSIIKDSWEPIENIGASFITLGSFIKINSPLSGLNNSYYLNLITNKVSA